MTMTAVYTARGMVLAMQEERFRLLTEDGRCLLLGLPRSSFIRIADLKGWHYDNTLIEVTYTGEANLESGIAQKVRVLIPERA